MSKVIFYYFCKSGVKSHWLKFSVYFIGAHKVIKKKIPCQAHLVSKKLTKNKNMVNYG